MRKAHDAAEPQYSPIKRIRVPLADVKPIIKKNARNLDDSGFSDCSISKYKVHSTPEHMQWPSPGADNSRAPAKRSYRASLSPQKPIVLPLALHGMNQFGSPTKLWESLCESADEKKTPQYARDYHVIDNDPSLQDIRITIYENILKLCSQLNLHRETFHLAMDLVDRYITRSTFKENLLERCGLIGMASLHIAGKVEEFRTPSPKLMLHFCRENNSLWQYFTGEQILKMEEELLSRLDYHCTPMTAIQWLAFFLQLIAIEEEICAPRPKRRSLSPNGASSSQHFTQDSGFSDLSTSPLVDKFDNHFEVHKTKTRQFAVPVFMRHEFIKLAEVLDISLIDKEWLHYSYRQLAAAVIFTSFEDVKMTEEITGFSSLQIQSTLNFIQPYYQTLIPQFYNTSIMAPNEQHISHKPKIQVFNSSSPSKKEYYDKHNIQPPHDNALDVMEVVEITRKAASHENNGNNNKKNLFGKATTPRKILSPLKMN
ncbi:unnamed protein product [Bursaphelenchus xylophilus]|uniref:(pine wood nematode) hypothetical protein n=1 Tax=Bursaphelenchus xylophilus TaxID=6326 RepID=A0A1I7RZA1_BURXY|nr:unnamed protein product [Bursaphelenchus xylophilus]CAG9106689.1 unnamed protein product [Bursaphelenchus xylophilus]